MFNFTNTETAAMTMSQPSREKLSSLFSISASAEAIETNLPAKPIMSSPRSQQSETAPTRIAQPLKLAASSLTPLDGDLGQKESESHSSPAEVAVITVLWRTRQRWHRAEKALVLQGKAFCRSYAHGDKDAGSKLFDLAQAGKPVEDGVVMALSPFLMSIESFEKQRAGVEKQLRKAAKQLPVWAWVKEQKGFGDLNLAAIVGEAGDVGSYKSVSALWKRMGLAVIDGERQRKKTDVEAAAAHGYNPKRRCVAYLLGDCLVKGNGEGAYRSVYLARKELEATRVATKAHAHNRAARYMTKRVLRDFYSAWRSDSDGPQPNGLDPSAML